MKKIKFLLLVGILSLGPQLVRAHGEDKPGPNGGFIRMPGAFHTEVIPTGPNSLKIYLLDIQWQNPSVVNSALSVTYKAKNTTQGKCSIEANYYVCKFTKNVDLRKSGELVVEAQRDNQKGNVVSYKLPLKLQGLDDGHGGHH